ncbi:MAG: hypothetical protein JWO95_1137, partial [Verrucomicrobiales bacterium]|nr:hypothetical protein [Verrucomicrobiales bacterium]
MPSRISRALLFVVLGLLSVSTGYTQTLHKTNSVEATLYDPDPGHIANRVYKAIFAWKADTDATPSHWPKQKMALDIENLKATLDELFRVDMAKEL